MDEKKYSSLVRAMAAPIVAHFDARTCVICGRGFKTPEGRNYHIKNYHGLTMEEYHVKVKEIRANLLERERKNKNG